MLVQIALTARGTTQTTDPFVVVRLSFEFVVVGEFFVSFDVSQSVNDNSLLSFHFDDLGSTTRVTAMVDETSYSAFFGCIDH